MALPLKIQVRGQGTVTIEILSTGIGIKGSTPPRLDLVVMLWDSLVSSLALDLIPLETYLGKKQAARRIAEARAALQVRLRGHP